MRRNNPTSEPPAQNRMAATPEDFRWNAQRSATMCVVVGLAAFTLGAVWYSVPVFRDTMSHSNPGGSAPPPAWKFAVAPLREILSAAVLLYLIDHYDREVGREHCN